MNKNNLEHYELEKKDSIQLLENEDIELELLYDAIRDERRNEIERRQRIERNHRERVRKKEFFCLRITVAFIAVGIGALISGYWIAQVKHEVDEKKMEAVLTAGTINASLNGNIIYQDWKLNLVNTENPISLSIMPEMSTLQNGIKVDGRIQEELEAMISAGKREAGLDILVVEGYVPRTQLNQSFNNKVEDYMQMGATYVQAYKEVISEVNLPGMDERELGLGVTLVGRDYQNLDRKQKDTATTIWLQNNCDRFGFILRYPEYGESSTGVEYKDWYYRYVGANVAESIMNDEITLEEYLGIK